MSKLPFETLTTKRADGESREYMLTKLPADVGFETAAMVGGLLAGPLGAALGGVLGLPSEGEAPTSSLDAKVTPEVLARGVQQLGASLRDPQLQEVVRRLLDKDHLQRLVMDRGEKTKRHVDWRTEFAGEYGALLEVALTALRYNFASFFVTGPAAGLSSAGLNLAMSSLRRGSTGGSPSSSGDGGLKSSST